MCGIAGIVDPALGPEPRQAMVARMCEAMHHRGPDDNGLHSSATVTIGMRRLAIFDPANGHQPMISPDGRFALVFNGAIYNYRALQAELSGSWQFRTRCDTEVLLAAFARWGEECLSRLRGMFAFAVWDEREQSLFLARDPFGIKPLYYRAEGESLRFASEISALASSGVALDVDPVAIADYLGWFSVPAPRTIFRGVRSLRPGETALWRAGRLTLRRAWTFRGIPSDVAPCRSRSTFIGELRERLDDTIRAHVVADVPVGAFLSGGLDSAVVVGLMSRAATEPLHTFSIGFDESAYSESGAAAASAQHFGTRHHPTLLTGARVAAEIERIISQLDQPTGDGLNTYYVSAAARAGGVTVALSGLGGDELFGGYPSFRDLPRLARWLPWWRAVPRGGRRALLRMLRRGETRRRKLADFLQYARDVHQLASMQRRVFSEPRRRGLLGPGAESAAGSLSPYHPELETLANDLLQASPLELAGAWELRTYMADVLLRDSDAMSMRHSLELRTPFVDRPLIEWLWRQPLKYRITPGQPKSALAAAAADVLPPGLAGRAKRGFSLPMPVWMRGELRPFLEETFSDSSLERARFFDRRMVQKSWRTFLDGGDTRDWSRVWSLAVVVAFVNRSREPAAPGSAPYVIHPPPPPRRAAAAGGAPPPAAKPTGPRRPPTLLMAPEIFSSSGGIQRMLQLYLRALADLGERDNRAVRLLALNDPMLDSRDIRRCAAGRLDDWAVCNRDKKRFLREAFRLSRGCDRIVCGHIAQLPVAWAVSRLGRRPRYYLVAHGIEVWRPFSAAEKMALRGAARVFCVSEYTRQELLHHAPIAPDRAVVVANGLDPAFPITPGRPLAECPPVIVTIARLTADDRYKGIEHLIGAMAEVRKTEPDAVLRIVGRGDDLPRLQALARRAGLLNAGVEFLGYLDDAQMAAELSACRLFALPSMKEGFGLVYLEAMAHGRPCVAARAAAAPEVVTADTGILCTPADPASVAAALSAGLRRSWDQERILARARGFSFECFYRAVDAALTTPEAVR